MSLRVVFAGTPEFSVPTLQGLLDSEHDVIAVFTQPDRPKGRGQQLQKSPVKALAEQYALPVHQPASLRNEDAVALFQTLNADVVVVVAYGLLIPANILSIPPYGFINVHASILPRWRGAAPIQYAIKSGDDTSGVTIMQMNEGLDTGDMLAIRACPIGSNETASQLHDRLSVMGPPALLDVLAQMEAGALTPIPQDDTQSTYASKLHKQDALIDWACPAEQIDRMVRAFNPWPTAFAMLNGQPMKVWRASVVLDGDHDSAPGTILHASEEGIEVATGAGVLNLLEIQLPGGKRLPVAEVLRSKAAQFAVGALIC